jgi:hypothetical protein
MDVTELLEKFALDLINELCPEYASKISIRDLNKFLDDWTKKKINH